MYPGETAVFSVNAAGALPLTYQWRKNGTDIPGANAFELTIANVRTQDIGQYTARVSNNFGSVTSNAAELTLLGANSAPVPVINTPVAGSQYRGGDVLQFSGSATDFEDGAVPNSALSWQLVFHHSIHVHDSPPVTGVASGEFQIPNSGEVADDVWYRIHFTARDLQGREGTVYRDILPYKSQITLNSDPQGLELTLDGQPIVTPYTVTGVEGILRQIGVTPIQSFNETEYVFDHWLHGGEASQTISTPQNDIAYTAVFAETITSVEEKQQRVNFIIFPNPVKDQLIVRNVPQSELHIVDMTGKTLHRISIQNYTNYLVIDMKLKPGIYFLKIADLKRVRTKKLVVRN